MSAIRFDEAARANLYRFAEQARRYAGESTTSEVPLFDLLITDRAVYAWALAVDDPPIEQPAQVPASIESMALVVLTEADGVKECSICLEEMGVGEEVKEMPCKHGFHPGCIEKWLGIHGSCPVCRYTMPVEGEEEDKTNEDRGSGGRRRQRTFAFKVTRIMRRENGPDNGDPVFSRWISSFFESGMGLQN